MKHTIGICRSLTATYLSLLVILIFGAPRISSAQIAAGNASFSPGTDQNLLAYDFGTFLTGPDRQFDFSVFNIPSQSGASASLTLVDVRTIGGSNGIQLQYEPVVGLAAGSSAPLSLVLKRGVVGDFAVNYLLEFASDGLPAGPLQLVTVSGFGRVVLDGDVDGDNDVDGDDFLVWQRGLGLGPNATLEQGDANLDGFVNGDDLVVWKSNYGRAAPAMAQGASTQVPEPLAAMRLFAVAGVAACRSRRFAHTRLRG